MEKEEKEENQIDENTLFIPNDIETVLKLFANLLSENSWRNLGLVADPVTGEAKKDLKRAKVAIDTIDFIAKKLEEIDVDASDIKVFLTQLQINFIKKSTEDAEGEKK